MRRRSMTPRNARPSRPSRSTGRTSSDSSARNSYSSPRSDRNEMGRYSRYSQGGRAYPGDKHSSMRPVVGRTANANTGAGQYSRNSSAYSHRAVKKKMGRGKKIALGIVAALVVALVGCGTALAIYIGNINSTLKGNLTDDQMKQIEDQLTSSNLNEPFYMVLIGSDIRDGQAQSESRSDTNILVRVDGGNNQVTMISIPRDTAIDIDGHGVSKFNNAYTYDGAAGVIREAGELCGVEIAHYAEVNFGNLVALVDAIGGVDVEVTEIIDDPKADGSISDPNAEHIVIQPGMQHLNGTEALVFARSRAYADGDFTRTENQRKLIQAIANKVLQLSPTELPGVIEAAAACVTTDLSVNEIIDLALQFQDEGDMTIYSAMIPSVAQYVNGVSYVFTDTDQLAEMMRVVEEGGDPSGITVSDEMLAEAIESERSGQYSSGSSGSYGSYSSYGSYGSYSSYGSYGSYGSGGYTSGYITSGGASGTLDSYGSATSQEYTSSYASAGGGTDSSSTYSSAPPSY